MSKWIAQVFGDPSSESFEISVVREDNEHGRKSWGWFDERKLLISSSGGPCRTKLAPGLAALMVELAEKYAAMLNGAPKEITPQSAGPQSPQAPQDQPASR